MPSLPRVRAVAIAGFVLLGASACGRDRPDATLDDLRQPTGLALSPEGRLLFVTNGNWDRSQARGGVLTLDLAALGGDGKACAAAPAQGRRSCDAAAMVVPGGAVGLGSAVGNLAVDRPGGDGGPLRLLTVQRLPSAVVWMDVVEGDDGPMLDCGQADDGECDDVHVLDQAFDRPGVELPDDPSRVVVDDQGYRFAYVPHLLGGAISLVALDGELGPELADVVGEFYRSDPFDETEYAGGFGVDARPCDLANPPAGSRECTRSVLYTSQRFFPSVRRFAVAPGLDVLVPGDESSLATVNPESVHQQPYLGDLAFEDPAGGTSLLVVQTTPASLLRVDTTVADDGDPRDAVVGMLPLCEQPNLLALHRPSAGEPLALVSCFADGELAIVGLSSWRVLAQLALGAGANEIAIDAVAQRAYVANTLDDSISVVSLDRDAAGYLAEIARIE